MTDVTREKKSHRPAIGTSVEDLDEDFAGPHDVTHDVKAGTKALDDVVRSSVIRDRIQKLEGRPGVVLVVQRQSRRVACGLVTVAIVRFLFLQATRIWQK